MESIGFFMKSCNSDCHVKLPVRCEVRYDAGSDCADSDHKKTWQNSVNADYGSSIRFSFSLYATSQLLELQKLRSVATGSCMDDNKVNTGIQMVYT